MIAMGLFSESMGFDITIISIGIGLFVSVVVMFVSLKAGQRAEKAEQRQAKATRAAEMEAAVLKVINASPNKVVVDPQPFLVKMEQEFVPKLDFDALTIRVAALEVNRHNDLIKVMSEIANVPARVIELLRTTKDLL